MAPASKDSAASAGGEERFNLLKLAIKCTNGTIDFDMFAAKIGSPNAEAARKKFKRIFEKDDEALNLVGSTLSNGSGGSSSDSVKTRTPRGKASNGETASGTTSVPKTRALGRKRKAAEIKEESDQVSDNEEVATPKKKAKKVTSTKTPKPPKTPKTPRTPRTPKGAASVKEDTEESEVDLKDSDNEAHEARAGSPEVQAKTDSIVKANEKATDGEIGDIEKQAILDGVQKEMAVAEDDE